jgi:ABC-2 type transport system ATP-binding protein
VIEATQLSKTFGENVAVESVDLQIDKGEAFGFLGPNGAGKTTMVRMLAALIGPSSGSAKIAGYDVVEDAAAVRQSTGILTETPGLYVHLNAEENLRFYAELYEIDKPAKRVQKYLELVDLWERRDEPVGGFSKGMRQRVAVARALLNEPPVIFRDEPTSGLDPQNAAAVRDAIEELKKRGHTIFICTHNLPEAERLCDRIGIMRSRLIRVDSAEALRSEMYGNEILVQLREVTEACLLAARSVAGVASAERDGQVIVVTVEDPNSHNPALVRAVVEAGGDIQFVERQQHSLEKIYMELIAEGET